MYTVMSIAPSADPVYVVTDGSRTTSWRDMASAKIVAEQYSRDNEDVTLIITNRNLLLNRYGMSSTEDDNWFT